MYRMATENGNKGYTKLITLFLISVLFIVPLGLWFSMMYVANGGLINSLLIFGGIYGLSFLIVLIYYRMNIQDDIEAKIDKINKNKVQFIAGITFLSFSILLITIFILATNPELITVFENTIGIWFIGLIGNSGFCNEIFHSDIFSKLRKESENPKIFNQNFLLTRFNNENIEDFVKFYKEDCSKQDEEDTTELPFDFTPVFKNEGQLNKLRELVNLKRLVGYFSWIYVASIVSLTMSIIGVTMKTF